MPDRVREYFETWCSENIKPTPFAQQRIAAEHLSRKFQADAEREGILPSELKAFEDDLGQDLISEFVDCIEERINGETAAQASRDPF